MIGILIITIVALILALILVFIDTKINKKTKDEEYLELLPGYNCGVCGYAGCKGMSEAMLDDIDNYKKCKLLRGEKLKELEEYLKGVKK